MSPGSSGGGRGPAGEGRQGRDGEAAAGGGGEDAGGAAGQGNDRTSQLLKLAARDYMSSRIVTGTTGQGGGGAATVAAAAGDGFAGADLSGMMSLLDGMLPICTKAAGHAGLPGVELGSPLDLSSFLSPMSANFDMSSLLSPGSAHKVRGGGTKPRKTVGTGGRMETCHSLVLALPSHPWPPHSMPPPLLSLHLPCLPPSDLACLLTSPALPCLPPPDLAYLLTSPALLCSRAAAAAGPVQHSVTQRQSDAAHVPRQHHSPALPSVRTPERPAAVAALPPWHGRQQQQFWLDLGSTGALTLTPCCQARPGWLLYAVRHSRL